MTRRAVVLAGGRVVVGDGSAHGVKVQDHEDGFRRAQIDVDRVLAPAPPTESAR